jgi:hypothetical protein
MGARDMTYIFRTATAALCACVLSTAAAWGEDKLVSSFHAGGKGSDAGYDVNFNYECGEECYAATLRCDGNGTLWAVYADVTPEAAAKAVMPDSQSIGLEADGKTFELTVSELSFVEMTGSWSVTAFAMFDSRDAYAALRKARSVTMKIAGESLALPGGKDIDALVKACSK